MVNGWLAAGRISGFTSGIRGPKLTIGHARESRMTTETKMNDAEWRKRLTPEQYRILREHGTERAFTHPYNAEKGAGMYVCAGCGAELFNANAKFDSGTGWPSYFQPASKDAVSEHSDRSWFMTRTEVRCANCDGHLGHVFPDGPKPTGLRYCMNGAALDFKPDKA
jgi:peptide-methionine (R)-S-oxide reductase